ncbi:MAG: response regulator [Cytophagales bacterium]|nr:MAG: response regulator [Cytophagales bacterium]
MIPQIMCIDDDKITLMFCETMLKKQNIAKKVITFIGAEEALDYLAQKNDVDFIFLDLNMPHMDGWEFLEIYVQKIQPQYPKIKILILSSSINPDDIERAQQYPIIIHFISKPLTVQNLENLKSIKEIQPFFV